MTIDAILFDKDGTLLDFDGTWAPTLIDVMDDFAGGDAAAGARLAAAMGIDVAARRFRPNSPFISGMTADYGPLWAKALGHDGGPAYHAAIDEALRLAARGRLAPLGDLGAVAAALRARGIRLGVATNDTEAAARGQIGELGLLPAMDFVVGCDSGHGGKPAPGMVLAFAAHLGLEPRRVAMVGDSRHDLDAARAAGALGIAVLSGLATRADLEPRADHVIEDVSALPAFVDRLRGRG